MLSQLINQPCTITRRSASSTKDEYGNEIPDEELVETVCELQQQQRREASDQGETSDTTWLLILPAGTQISTADVVDVDGVRFEMVGAPWHARNPRTKVASHIEATVRRTAGAEDT